MKQKTLLLILLSGLFGIYSCGNKKAEERADNIKEQGLSVPENVSTVTAIGKIEPEEGLVELASQYGGIVSKIMKKEGDVVAVGDVILILNAETEKADESVIQNQIAMQRRKADADLSNVKQYEVQLAEIERDLAVSQRLAETGAETFQNVDTKKKDRDVTLANLNTARKNAAASASDIAVLESQLKKARQNTLSMTVRAEQKGRIVIMNVRVGTSVSPLTSFATLAPSDSLVVHGEIDEMFASRVKIGDQVSVKVPGTNDTLASAEVHYLSPILEDKSLFYEKAGEQADRRVRRFKAVLNQGSNVLINQKVECAISL